MKRILEHKKLLILNIVLVFLSVLCLSGFFIVSGTPRVKFGWELKAKQSGYEQNRLDERRERIKYEEETYASDGANYVQEYMEGLIL